MRGDFQPFIFWGFTGFPAFSLNADFHLNLHGWSKDVILDSGERDVAYCVNPGRTLASRKPDGDEWAKVILLDFVEKFSCSIRVQV